MIQPRPIAVFFAFANDRAERARYLRNLPEEQRRVREAMEEAVEAGLCEVVERSNATIDEVLDVFQDPGYRDRIAIFHFGGHAGDAALLLESAAGEATVAHAGGLARFLGTQRGLELVFLNGCSSRGQVQGLLDAGAPAVIATSEAIDDAVATEFAARFYKALASGASVRTAYTEAQGAVQARRGEQARGTYRSFVPDEVVEDRWPWDLYVAPGAEERLARWSLAVAARDPLFGLPPLPAMDLPASPFKHLSWFGREDAHVFFGRGREIRDLYEAVTRPDAEPIILLFGATGAGKSSLLAAGLAPRLETTHEVIYLRRDGALGLAGTLNQAFGEQGDWRAREEATGKPLVVILDQAEEAWTRPLAERKEPEELAAALRSMFGVRETRPRGRLILGFRKEWLAEVLRLVDGEKLPRFRVEITHLDRDAIAEAVSGPACSESLRRQYRLEIEPALAEIIADDLLEDPGAAIAPALQILLSKMWTLAMEESPGAPKFTVDLYRRLKREGILLDDFLGEQLEGLRQWRPELVESGLVLDLLGHHTTALGTAETRDAAEVAARYGGRPEVAELLRQCQDRYLLSAHEEKTRLAHDTLAPLVRRRFEASEFSGQRALRILQTRATEWVGGKDGPPLDDSDLAAVERGAAGMRAWTADEQRLIEKSQRERARRRRVRRFQRWAAVLALMATLGAVAALPLLWTLKKEAAEEAGTARGVTEFMGKVFRDLDPVSVTRMLDRSRKRIETDLVGAPRAQDRLRETIGVVDRNMGRLGSAEALLRRVVDYRRGELGEEHPDTLLAKNELADVFADQARFEEAEKLYRQTLESRRQVLGEEHPDTLRSLSNLANLLEEKGRFKEADGTLRQVAETMRRVLGEQHPDTLKALSNLANGNARRGRLQEAEDQHRQLLGTYRRRLGEEHPDTLASMTNLANVVSLRGRPAEAEELNRKAFEISRRVLGEEHPDTLMYWGNLADTWYAQGRLNQAEEAFRRILAIRRRMQGAGHPNTVAAMNNMAVMEQTRGRLKEGEDLLRQALVIHRRVLGDDHPATLSSMMNLAAGYLLQNRGAEAEILQRQALARQRQVLGEAHPDTLKSLNNLATIVHAQGRPKEAEGLLLQALALLSRELGEAHPDTLRATNQLAGMYREDSRLHKAEALYRQTLAGFRRALGGEHPDTIWTMGQLAATLQKQGRLPEAEALFLQVLEHHRRVLGEKNMITLNAMLSLAEVYHAQGRLREEDELKAQALALFQQMPEGKTDT